MRAVLSQVTAYFIKVLHHVVIFFCFRLTCKDKRNYLQYFNTLSSFFIVEGSVFELIFEVGNVSI